MLKQLRQNLIQCLWENYRATSVDMQPITAALQRRKIDDIKLDHFAVIDLPGPHSGIPILKKIFSALGYIERGKDYLAEKQNDFLWMCEEDSTQLPASQALPQVVVADFRLDEMPPDVRAIIAKYSAMTKPFVAHEIEQLAAQGHSHAAEQLLPCLLNYFAGRDWPLPTKKEFFTVQEFNELLAWVLIFGRKPNHFTLSVHLLEQFKHLDEFHEFIMQEAQLKLNDEGGVVKGGKEMGIAQGSTVGVTQTVMLADGEIQLANGFVEFVWRYPRDEKQNPVLWNDYFTGFIARHADRVIESLYIAE